MMTPQKLGDLGLLVAETCVPGLIDGGADTQRLQTRGLFAPDVPEDPFSELGGEFADGVVPQLRVGVRFGEIADVHCFEVCEGGEGGRLETQDLVFPGEAD